MTRRCGTERNALKVDHEGQKAEIAADCPAQDGVLQREPTDVTGVRQADAFVGSGKHEVAGRSEGLSAMTWAGGFWL
ncbi:hypothetical protein GCM10010280_65260 [Streptomyces pilosus]|uniref:Uncharacterized protein n=1 Tax=Streptomyces pilosus TaxID=28893 RepID=A0A918C806_9ACTN|nr:hypothetical protein GCM10010280_65260 [Streptomyces pilosus]